MQTKNNQKSWNGLPPQSQKIEVAFLHFDKRPILNLSYENQNYNHWGLYSDLATNSTHITFMEILIPL